MSELPRSTLKKEESLPLVARYGVCKNRKLFTARIFRHEHLSRLIAPVGHVPQTRRFDPRARKIMSMLQLQGVCLAFPHKTCFADFDAVLEWGQRIAIVGDNGSGKSSLLKMLHGSLTPQAGQVTRADALRIGYVPQIVTDADTLSGGERINRALSRALAEQPDLLLLDEPSNHLDVDKRRALRRMLRHYPGAIVLVSHDLALLDDVCDSIWHIGQGKVQAFTGRYADYLLERTRQRHALEIQREALKREQQAVHAARMQEQERASKARVRGARGIAEHKWPTVKSVAKLARGNATAGRKQAAISAQQRALSEQLSALERPEIIVPRFQLTAALRTRSILLQISAGSVGYAQPVLSEIHLSLAQGERLALIGGNGSGKSTLAMAIAGVAPARRLAGDWLCPSATEIGYLDQHYAGLPCGVTVLGALRQVVPDWPLNRLRHFLGDFLFRADEAVRADVATLSGGERARLTLACLAARPPALLILDEMTNNLDLATRRHVIEALRDYPGAMMLISHDEPFLQELGDLRRYEVGSRKKR
jgi:ATPase subunit of ABC transporter with duplicated ATPase domains